jgi:hypothetical protein
MKSKRKNFGLEARTFRGRDKKTYLVFLTTKGSYHVLVEVEAKEAARQCGAEELSNTRAMWESLWKAT